MSLSLRWFETDNGAIAVPDGFPCSRPNGILRRFYPEQGEIGLRQGLVVCEQCNAVHRTRPLASSEVASCSRCAAAVGRGHRLGVHGLLALTIAAMVMLLIANLTPVVDIRLGGLRTDVTLPAAIHLTWQLGEHLVAVTAAFTAIVGPALLIGLRLLLLVPMARGRMPRHFAWAARALHEASYWSMVEVLMVAAVVSIVRMASMAHAVPGAGMYAFGALALLLAGLETGGVKHLWAQVR
jgi:paraquat-inducible protein A